MKTLRSVSFTALAAIFVGLAVAGCTSTGNTGQYRTGGGSGWENFRAEAAPAGPVTQLS
jgi:uncharacterized protein YraI